MKLPTGLLCAALTCVTCLTRTAAAASSKWAVEDSKFSILKGGTTIRSGDLNSMPDLASLELNYQATLELSFTATKDKSAAKPHQAAVFLRDPESGLEFGYAAVYKAGYKARVTIPYNSVPKYLQTGAESPLQLELVIGSFDAAVQPLRKVLTRKFIVDSSSDDAYIRPKRLGALPEIRHVFSQDPKTVSSFVALVFSAASCVIFLGLLVSWAATGSASLKSLPQALKNCPLGYLGLLGSLGGYELLFFLYYKHMSVFDALTYGALLGPVAIYCGSRALREFSTRV